MAVGSVIPPEYLGSPQHPRNACERIELFSVGELREQKQEHDIDRLIVDGLEVDAVA